MDKKGLGLKVGGGGLENCSKSDKQGGRLFGAREYAFRGGFSC